MKILRTSMGLIKKLTPISVFILSSTLAYLAKGDDCKPVCINIILSGAKDEASCGVMTAVTGDIAQDLPPGSKVTITAMTQKPQSIFTGTLPQDMMGLKITLAKYEDDGVWSQTVSGQLLFHELSNSFNSSCSGAAAEITIVMTFGNYDKKLSQQIREKIITVVQMDLARNYSSDWQTITADNTHYLAVDEDGKVPIQQIITLICKDSNQLCGTSGYGKSDGETVVCYNCSSICISGFLDSYCNRTCPYYRPPKVPVPNPEPVERDSSKSAGLIIVCIVVIVVIVVSLAVVGYCVIRRKQKKKQASAWHQGNHMQGSNGAGSADSQPPEQWTLLPEQDTSVEEGQGTAGCSRADTISLNEPEMDTNADTFNGPMRPIRDRLDESTVSFQ